LLAGKIRRYRLAASDELQPSHDGVAVRNDGKSLVVKVGEKPVLHYNHAIVSSPPPLASYYGRSGYIHPLLTPAGTMVTDDFNHRNPHQHGVMFAWRKASFKGHDADCWDQRLQRGRVEHAKIEAYGGGDVFGHFTVKLRHVCLKSNEAPEVMLEETWRVKIANVDQYFLFDLESTQSAASDIPLNVKRFDYGGFAIRASAAWGKDGGRGFEYLTSEGNGKNSGNHTRPRWVDIFGTIEPQVAGVAIMAHPENFRFPQPVRLHPTLPYFCFSPPVLGPFKITKTAPLVSRFRFAVHDGPPEVNLIERLWNDYANPPTVRLIYNP